MYFLKFMYNIQWNLSKPILIRTKEKYLFRQVIGLDRLTFTSMGNIIFLKIEIHTLHKASIIKIIRLFIVVWTYIALAISNYQASTHYIMAWNQLVVFLRKQLMDMTNSSWLIGLYSGNKQNLSYWDPKSISVFGVDRFRFRQDIY